jgi:hypothetical protein
MAKWDVLREPGSEESAFKLRSAIQVKIAASLVPLWPFLRLSPLAASIVFPWCSLTSSSSPRQDFPRSIRAVLLSAVSDE